MRLIFCAALSVALVSAALGEQTPMPLTREAHLSSGLFSLPEAMPNAIVLHGDIGEAAAEAYLAALRRRPHADTLIVNSSGGTVWEALQIARYVHLGKLRTVVPSGENCFSVCAYIFLAGDTRVIEAGGRLGVQQIYGETDPSRAQATFSYVFDALRDFGVADGVISIMLRTTPENIHEFTRAEIVDFRLVTPVTTAEAVAAIDAANTLGGQSLLLEASDDGKTGAVPFSGSIEWSKGTDDRGVPTLVGKATIPARNLSVDLLIRKNSDTSLPASHLVEVNFKVNDSFIGGSIHGLPGVLLKNEELVQGAPLVGASARVVGNSFLFTLSGSPEDVTANIKLLRSRRWIDLALIYATGKRAIITLEKDAAAASLFRDVIAEWDRPANVGVSSVGKSADEGGLGRSERVVEVRDKGSLKDTLLQNGFDDRTFDMVAAALSNVLNSVNMPAGAHLRILMGPSRSSEMLIPHRLSIYFPDARTGEIKHAATVALTDRGEYVLGLAPEPILLPDGRMLGSSRLTVTTERSGKDARYRPTQ